MSPAVSVILPYRNVAETIETAVQSTLDQTLPAIEVLAIDDGSTDSGPDRVRALAARDHRVRCLQTPGVGIVRALELGLEHARGTMIGRMDGDDLCLPRRLEQQAALLRQSPRVAAAGVQVEGFPASAVAEGMRRYIQWQNELLTPEDHAREIFVEAPLCHPSVLIRRSALHAVGGWRDAGWPEDYDLWLRFDAAGWGMAKVPEVLLRWRHRPHRATFQDRRYALDRFRWAKAGHLARRVRNLGRPLVVWGAGPTGKRLARALEAHALFPSFFVDIDPNKIGRTARNARILSLDSLTPRTCTVIAAVGARGARAEIRSYLNRRGFREGSDFLFAA